MLQRWLAKNESWDEELKTGKALQGEALGAALRRLAGAQMQFLQVQKLDRLLTEALSRYGSRSLGLEPVKVVVMGSSTTSHLVPGLRVAGLRRGFAVSVYETPYGMYQQELRAPLAQWLAAGPDVVLLALDARHLLGNNKTTALDAMKTIAECWRLVRERCTCQVLQQAVLPVFPTLFGNHEDRFTQSPAARVAELNALLRAEAAEAGVDLLAVDTWAAQSGIGNWYDPVAWYQQKQEVHPTAATAYGEQAMRLIAASRGRSAKCLVLDLDNTLWGGVIGDDGLTGIVLGQGSGTGEAFADFQRYVKQLADRGVVLAVCSKNEEATALEAFDRHPEMVLRREDIACFVANWQDKATNLRAIAQRLNLALDALVFVDDNPFERELVRRELPSIAVFETPEDPAEYATALAGAGYFEALSLTQEDLVRKQSYQANALRHEEKSRATDEAGYLASLDMVLSIKPCDPLDLVRVTQLINKTNQFNLMTERLHESEVSARMADPQWITLQARLSDRFGDNGIIAVLMAKVEDGEATIETWLMSCRVLGRYVEQACLQVLVEQCRERSVNSLIGMYRETAKNAPVRDLYTRLGFEAVTGLDENTARYRLELAAFQPKALPMTIKRG